MKINLIRDRNVDQEVYAQVVDLLQSTPGAIQFKGEFIVEEEEEPEVQFSISFKNKIISEKSADIESSTKEQHLPQASMAYKPRFSWRKLFERSNIC